MSIVFYAMLIWIVKFFSALFLVFFLGDVNAATIADVFRLIV